MKKFLILTLVLTVATTAYAQKSSKALNKEYGQEYKKIGTDPTLTGYEKGQKKRQLALKQKQANIENNNQHKGNINSNNDLAKKDIEAKIDKLDKQYDRDKSKIDKNASLTKKEKKAQKRNLEKKYKSQKEILKKEKDKY